MLMEIEDYIATSTCERSLEYGVLTLACFWEAFSLLARWTTWTTAPAQPLSKQFYGTGIGHFQSPTKTKALSSRSPLTLSPSRNEFHSLTDNYASVPTLTMKTTAVAVPECDVFTVMGGCLDDARKQKQCWVEHALTLLEIEQLTSGDAITWDAYYASIQPP